MEGAYLGYSLGASLGFETALLSLGYMWEKDKAPFKCKFDNIQCASAFYTISTNSHNSEWGFYNIGDIAF